MNNSEISSYRYDRIAEEYECFEINGEEYRVRSFDAFTGISAAKIAWKNYLGGKLRPNTSLGDLFVAMALEVLKNDELITLAKYSMKVCEKRLKSGWTSIVDKAGNYQVPEIETDSAATFIIMKHAVVFGTSCFFSVLSSGLK